VNFIDNVPMMFMDYLLMGVSNDWLFNNSLDNGCLLMADDSGLGNIAMEDWCFVMSDNNWNLGSREVSLFERNWSCHKVFLECGDRCNVSLHFNDIGGCLQWLLNKGSRLHHDRSLDKAWSLCSSINDDLTL